VLFRSRRLDLALNNREFGKKWKVALAKADLKITVAEYMALHVITTIGFFLVGIFILCRGNIVGALIAGVIGFFAPRIYVSRKQNKRLILFETQLPDTISLWVNGLRSGYSVLQAMEAIAKESPEPTASEFRRVVQEVQLGITWKMPGSHAPAHDQRRPRPDRHRGQHSARGRW
jgi:tight adherence protein B